MPARRLLAFALMLAPLPALAQGPLQPVGVSDADALADQVRRLGANPLDLEALLTAGEISIRLEDYSAAGAFFARAERIDPRSGRAKAGEGAIMAHSERPAESLRFFAQAEQYGIAPQRFAAERGLAYDLLGDPGRAQRDYRQALADRDDPEARRRYALSLAIAGRQAQALDQLAPLIRQNDRAAWRTRAFVLAMGGDSAGALRIAETMMPPGAATSLQQFFVELPRLPAVDRAFAVHFGEVRATPQRLADARLAPREAPLPLEPERVQVAVAVPPPVDNRRTRRDRHRRNEPAIAVAIAAPPPPPLPPTPAYQAPAYTPPSATTPVRDRPLTAGELASLSAAGNRSPGRRTNAAQPAYAAPSARPLTAAEQASLAAAGGRGPIPVKTVARPAPAPVPVDHAAAAATGRPASPVKVVAVTPAPVRKPIETAVAALPPARPPAQVATPPAPRPPVEIATAALPPARPADAVARPDATPAPVYGPPAGAAPAPALGTPPDPVAAVSLPAPGFTTAPTTPLPTTVETIALTPVAPPAEAPLPAVAPPVIATSTPPAPLVVPPRPATAFAAPRRSGRGQADSVLSRIVAGLTIPASELDVAAAVPGQPTAADRRAADRRAAAATKALADRRVAVAAQAEADRDAAEERRAARAEPARIWVQVAGGANEAGLALAWRTMRDRAPQVLGPRQAWTTPLRATNRVLTGPFRTDAEARAVINDLGRAGVRAFAFTSEAGQKVARLAVR